MPNEPAVTELIERLVRESQLPNARARDDLGRELAAHFADAAAGGQVVGDAVARFGDPGAVAAGLRRAYRPGRPALYAAKVAAAILVSAGIAVPVQAAAHLRIALRLAPSAGLLAAGRLRGAPAGVGVIDVALTPWFPFAAHVAFAVVLLAVAAWELDVEPACRQLERYPARLAAAVLVLFATSLAVHARWGLRVDPAEAFVGAAATVAVWTASLAVAARADRVLLRILGGAL